MLFVLVILALCSAVVVAMVTVSEGSIARSRSYDEAAAAGSLVSAGEVTALIALRRDMVASPGLDHGREAWAQVNQADVAIADGRFSLTLRDAQGLFNLTNLATEGILAQNRLADILSALGLKADLATQIVDARPARLTDLQLSPDDLAILRTMVTVLPQASTVNVNTASAPLLSVLLKNPVQAKLLEVRRAKQGFLTPEDVSGLGIVLPAGLGFSSVYFDLTVTAQVGDTVVMETALVARRLDNAGKPRVSVVARQFGPEAAVVLSALPEY
ncbi:MAG: general secretion pathway protein GspK [Pseudorhodobacter sp.]|nr:general secretion pathway protein GspK [Pseudorhodobacter sp.]